MVTRLSDLDYLEEPMPGAWAQALANIHAANGNRQFVEAEKLRMQIALLTTQANVALHVEASAAKRAGEELEAASLRAKASDRIARSLRTATWVLAGATVALFLATVVLVFRN